MHVHVQLTKPARSKAYYAYPACYMYSIPTRIQQIAELDCELKTPRQFLL